MHSGRIKRESAQPTGSWCVAEEQALFSRELGGISKYKYLGNGRSGLVTMGEGSTEKPFILS